MTNDSKAIHLPKSLSSGGGIKIIDLTARFVILSTSLNKGRYLKRCILITLILLFLPALVGSASTFRPEIVRVAV